LLFGFSLHKSDKGNIGELINDTSYKNVQVGLLFSTGEPLNSPIFFNLYEIKTIHFVLIMLWGIYTFSFNKESSVSVFGIAPVFSPFLLTLPASFFYFRF